MNQETLYKHVKEIIEKDTGVPVQIELTNLKRVRDGFSNDIAMFTLKFYTSEHEFNKEIVYKDYSKSYKNNSGITKFKKEVGIFNGTVSHKHVSLPDIYFADEEKMVVLMEKIEGLTLDRIHSINPERFDWAIKKFGKSLASIHSLSPDLLSQALPIHSQSCEGVYQEYLIKLKNRILDYDAPEYLKILDAIVEKFKAVRFHDPVLNHGDYHFWNVLLTEADQLYILDWEKARIVDGRYDLANTFILCYSWFGIDLRKKVLGVYQSVKGEVIEHIEAFEALLSFDSFTSCLPLIQGGDDTHIRDKTFLWLKRRYELFAEKNETRVRQAEEYLKSKDLYTDW